MFLHGIIPPITTPFTPDGDIYFKKLEFNVDRFCRAPIAGIAVLGSTGEAILLSDQERRDVLRVAREAAPPEKVLLAGTGIESARETLRLTEYAAELGYDAALIRTPHFYKAQMNRAENMLAFYHTVADRSPLPVVIYNFPQNTGYDMPNEVVARLAEHPNIIGIKESSGNIEKTRALVELTQNLRATATVTEQQQAVTGRMLKQAASAGDGNGAVVPVGALGAKPSSSAVEVIGALKTRQKEVGFQVLVGAAQKLLPALQAGAVGAILQFACAAPTACFEVYTAHKEHAADIAREKQQRITEAAEKVSAAMGVSGTKYGMDLNGYYGGPVRLPLLPLTAGQKSQVEQLMANIKN